MIFGNKPAFAIEVEIDDVVDGWVLGRICFWTSNEMIGDWQDTTDLRGCARWMREFLNKPLDRRAPLLEKSSAADVIRALVDEIMPSRAEIKGPSENYKATFNAQETLKNSEMVRRFHVSHLGMSSLDRFDAILLEVESGEQRFVWRDGLDGKVGESILRPEEVQRVVAEFCEWFDAAVANF
jgi:hypothetical protein